MRVATRTVCLGNRPRFRPVQGEQHMRPKGSAAELERRRMRAVELIERGESPGVVARILGVARPTLYRWRKAARSRPDGLAAKPHPGPTPALSEAQLAQLEGLLLGGATAHGCVTDIWTVARDTELFR